MRSGSEQQESRAAALATEEYDYDDNGGVGSGVGDEDVPTNYMYPDQLDYNQYEDEMERSYYEDDAETADDYWQKETDSSSRTTSDDDKIEKASDSFYKDKKPVFENPKRIKQYNNNKSSTSSSSSSFSSIIRQNYDKFTQLFSNRSNDSRVATSVSMIQIAIGVLVSFFFSFNS